MLYTIILILIVFGIYKWYYDTGTAKSQFTAFTKTNHHITDVNLAIFRLNKARYLQSQEWQNKRQLVLLRDNFQCANCGSRENLTIHHHYGYGLIPNEPIECLETLCIQCHTKLHEKIGYPQTVEEYYKFDSRKEQKRNYQ